MKTSTSSNPSLLAFFLLAVVLLVPFLVYGALTGLQLAPGLPVAALATFCPVGAAIILVYRQDRQAGVVALLKRAFDIRRIKNIWWYAPLLLTMPIASADWPCASAGSQRWMLHWGPGRRTGLVRLCHSAHAGTPGTAQDRPSAGDLVGSVSFHRISPGPSYGRLDCLVDALHCGRAGDDGLALQPDRQECLWHGTLPHDDQCDLASLPGWWVIFRSTCHRLDPCGYGGKRGDRLGTGDARLAEDNEPGFLRIETAHELEKSTDAHAGPWWRSHISHSE